MKKSYIGTVAVLVVLASFTLSLASPSALSKPSCTTIQQGVLTYSAGHYLAGQPLTTGFDPYGYNYQGSMFLGSYANAYLGRMGYPAYTGDDAAYLAANPGAQYTWVWPYRTVSLQMQWNNAWLSNKDCDGDGLLDRHLGYATYVGSEAWLTNHQSEILDGQANWNYFVKIVAAPATAYKAGIYWYQADGTMIGKVIWGDMAIIQRVYNDQATGDHGLLFLGDGPAGFGYY